jgi:hypothetical protein
LALREANLKRAETGVKNRNSFTLLKSYKLLIFGSFSIKQQIENVDGGC